MQLLAKQKRHQILAIKLMEIVANKDLEKQSWGKMMKINAELAEKTKNQPSIEDTMMKSSKASFQDAQNFVFHSDEMIYL